jgi:hypothetical protein
MDIWNSRLTYTSLPVGGRFTAPKKYYLNIRTGLESKALVHLRYELDWELVGDCRNLPSQRIKAVMQMDQYSSTI